MKSLENRQLSAEIRETAFVNEPEAKTLRLQAVTRVTTYNKCTLCE